MINRIGFKNYQDFNRISRVQTLDKVETKNNDNAVVPHSYNDYRALKVLSFNGLVEIARRKARYPQDHLYRIELARNLGCKPDSLMSVLGEQEFKDILSTLTPEDFNVGKDLKNVKDGLFKANLHIHTTDSDGLMQVEELLDQAVKYANRMKNPPFIFSVTNHDVLNDTKKVLELIAKNPDKYKNVRFVPGIEITSQYKNRDIFVEPIAVDILSYCINPFDITINTFLDNVRDENLKYAKDISDKLAQHGLKIDFDQLVKESRYIEINGNLYILRKQLLKHAKAAGIDESLVHRLFDEHEEKFGNILVSKATPTFQDLGKHLKTGMLTMAHPGRYGFYHPEDLSTTKHLPKRINYYKLQKGVNPLKALKDFFTDFKNTCGNTVEVNYPYGSRYADPETNMWLLAIKKVVEELDFIHTGGLDTHSKDIFRQK